MGAMLLCVGGVDVASGYTEDNTAVELEDLPNNALVTVQQHGKSERLLAF